MPTDVMQHSSFYDFEMKEVDESGVFEGYASTFGGPPDLQGDIIAPGAFAKTLAKSKGKIPILMGHITSRIVGFGTHAEENEHGLLLRGEFTLGSDEGRNAYAIAQHAAKIGHKLGLSIGYSIREGGAEFDERGGSRTIKNLDLYEVSIAALPANTRARMTRVKDCTTVREAERFLCGLGLTGNEAREFISLCKVERDAKPFDDGELERDAKESHRRAAEAFMAEMRQASLIHSMKGII